MHAKLAYLSHESCRMALKPAVEWCGAISRILNSRNTVYDLHTLSPAAATFELLYRIGKTYEKPSFRIQSCTTKDGIVDVHEQIVEKFPFCHLIHFRKDQEPARSQPRLLIVAPLSGHHSTLIRETVTALLPDNDIYLTDWLDAKIVPQSEGVFGLNEYVSYIRSIMNHLGENTHILAICQPTVPVLGAVALMASAGEVQPRSVTLLAGPIDTRKSPTSVNEFAAKHSLKWFEQNMIDVIPPNYPGAGRNVYPGYLQHAAFISMNPTAHIQSHLKFYQDVLGSEIDKADAHRKFYDEYNAVLDMPAQFYLDTIKVVFKEQHLARGEWVINGEAVRPQDIKSPALLTIEGEKDDICGKGQTEAALDLCSGIPSSMKNSLVVDGVGHYGVFSGRTWREKTAPIISKFIREND